MLNEYKRRLLEEETEGKSDDVYPDFTLNSRQKKAFEIGIKDETIRGLFHIEFPERVKHN